MTKRPIFQFPTAVRVRVVAGQFITNGAGISPGISSEEGTTTVHWFEGRERLSVIAEIVLDTPTQFQWRTADGRVIELSAMTPEAWNREMAKEVGLTFDSQQALTDWMVENYSSW